VEKASLNILFVLIICIHLSCQKIKHKKIDARLFWVPKGIQFEPILAHFEQLRQMYEIQNEEDENV